MSAFMLVFGILTVLSSCGVVFSVKTLNCALWLIVTLFLMAVHYAFMGADFLAALQILVYAGAIMVLVIFVIMLLGLNERGEERGRAGLSSYLAVTVSGAFVGLLMFMTKNPGVLGSFAEDGNPVAGTPEAVGHALFTDFLYPFEITSVLLLAAIIGAVIIAYEPKRPLRAGRGLKAKQSSTGAS